MALKLNWEQGSVNTGNCSIFSVRRVWFLLPSRLYHVPLDSTPDHLNITVTVTIMPTCRTFCAVWHSVCGTTLRLGAGRHHQDKTVQNCETPLPSSSFPVCLITVWTPDEKFQWKGSSGGLFSRKRLMHHQTHGVASDPPKIAHKATYVTCLVPWIKHRSSQKFVSALITP